MKENIKKAASLLRVNPHLLDAIMRHVKEIDGQFEMMETSPNNNIYAVKIIVQDNDENWYVSQDEPHDDKLWADARSDDRDMETFEYDDDPEDSDEDSDDDGDGGAKVEPKQPLLT